MVQNLRALRLRRGISQQQLADVIGTTQQSINKYENHSTEPDIDTLIRLADYFGTTVDELVGHAAAGGPACPEGPVPTREEALFLDQYRRLTREERRSIDLVVRNYVKNKP